MDNRKLFRKEVLIERRNAQFGGVCMNVPIQFSFLTFALSIFVNTGLMIILFLDATVKWTATGNLVLDHATHNLVVEFYVPIYRLGFIKVGDKVVINYDDYSYQQYGSGSAAITDICSVTDEVKRSCMVKADVNDTTRQLQVGMPLHAIISGPKKKIWQWLLSSKG